MAKRKRRKKKGKRLKRKIIRLGLLGIFSIAVLLTLFVFAVYHNIFGHIPDEDELKSIRHETATLIYSSDEQLIGKYFAENRTNVQWEQLPSHLTNALVSTEDARYFEHQGIDGRSLMRVLIKTIIMGDRSSGGGSTITQQLAKNLFGRKNHGILTMPVVKVKEAITAYRLEKIYTKQEILLLYLNTVPFGENTFGIEAAANRYFNKKTQEINIQESAVLIGILKANTYYNPRLHPDNAKERRNLVLELMNKHNYLTDEKTKSLKESPLELNYNNYKVQGPAPYFLYQVRKKASAIIDDYNRRNGTSLDLEKDGLKIRTTLMLSLQDYANKAVKEHLSSMQKHLNASMHGQKQGFISVKGDDKPARREIFTWEGIQVREITVSDSLWHYKKMLQAGMLIINPQNGNVLTWIGGNNFRFLPYDLVHAKRQAASAFKPILYATALEQGYSPCDYLDNEAHDFEEYPNWKPQNHDGESGGEVAMWYALANSMNLPTVDLYRRVGHQDLDYVCRKLGLSSQLPEGPASALGTMEVSLWELARAYSSFAAKGKIPQQNMILEIRNSDDEIIYKNSNTDKKQAMSESVAAKMNLMLLNATQSGTGRALYSRFGIRHQFAGKTGTSQNYSDARYVCYNNDMVIAVWVGASDPAIHFNNGSMGSGSRLALPVAGKTLQKAQQDPKLRGLFTAPVIPQDTSGMMNCQPAREKSAGREIWQKMVDLVSDDKKSVREKDSLSEHKTEAADSTQNQSGTKVGKFLKNLFGKKNNK